MQARKSVCDTNRVWKDKQVKIYRSFKVKQDEEWTVIQEQQEAYNTVFTSNVGTYSDLGV